MNFFEAMVSHLDNLSTVDQSKTAKTVSKTEYEIFCKEFVFDRLKGVSFAEAFCKKFNIEDIALIRISDEGAKFLIEKLGYIK